ALDDTILRAPFSGKLARKLVEKFENVLAREPVLVMQNDQLLEIKVSVPERDMSVHRGERQTDAAELNAVLRPRVMVSAAPGREFEARLTALSSVADPTTRTFEATFMFPSPEGVNIFGGMTAKVIVDFGTAGGVSGILIPATAVVSGEEGTARVWVIDTEKLTANARTVQVGEHVGTDIVVLAGIEPGETIAVSAADRLRDGMAVSRYEQ
ncbi:MAG: efflux RND transporter periplasmic adaptor subunit, partial [Longimicrobiales bacterium]